MHRAKGTDGNEREGTEGKEWKRVSEGKGEGGGGEKEKKQAARGKDRGGESARGWKGDISRKKKHNGKE